MKKLIYQQRTRTKKWINGEVSFLALLKTFVENGAQFFLSSLAYITAIDLKLFPECGKLQEYMLEIISGSCTDGRCLSDEPETKFAG